ncbi:MAG: divalent-cation tolerance protein CutA [Vicinamibacterales bacterium]
MANEYVVVLMTLPGDADAVVFGRTLVGERLAACVSVLAPVTSIYSWEGAIAEEQERQLIVKTSREGVAALWKRVRDLHPYDVPEFIVLPIVDGNDAYLRWISESVGSAFSA